MLRYEHGSVSFLGETGCSTDRPNDQQTTTLGFIEKLQIQQVHLLLYKSLVKTIELKTEKLYIREYTSGNLRKN